MLRMMDVEDGEEEDDDTEEEETDHKTAPHGLCEPAQSKRMSRFHKSHFIDISNKMPRPRMSPERGHTHTHTLWEPAQSKRMLRFHKSIFIRKITGRMLRTKTAPQTLSEPAQSKHMSSQDSPISVFVSWIMHETMLQRQCKPKQHMA